MRKCKKCKTYSQRTYRDYCNKCITSTVLIKTCKYCGDEFELNSDNTSFDKLINTLNEPSLQYCCSRSCRSKQAFIDNPEYAENNRKRLTKMNKSKEGRARSSRIGKITGSIAFTKSHQMYDGLQYCEICEEDTKHIIGVGCMQCHNRNPEVRKKATETRLKDGNRSQLETKIENALKSNKINYVYEYKDNRYPYKCDFYLVDEDIFIEAHCFWTHGKKFFDSTSYKDIQKLNTWKEKSKHSTSTFYSNAITCWTVADPEKREAAKKNNLNYLVLFKPEEVNAFIKSIEDGTYLEFIDRHKEKWT